MSFDICLGNIFKAVLAHFIDRDQQKYENGLT